MPHDAPQITYTQRWPDKTKPDMPWYLVSALEALVEFTTWRRAQYHNWTLWSQSVIRFLQQSEQSLFNEEPLKL